MPAPATIDALVAASVASHGQRPALGMAFAPALTYTELGARVAALASALSARGLCQGQTVAILAENSPNWGLAFLAACRAGAVAVPILPEFHEADVHHILRDAEVRLVFTSGRQIDKVLDCQGRLTRIVTLDDSDPGQDEAVLPLRALLAEGARLAAVTPVPVRPDDTAAIIYTSGTSGHSKGVMLSHANLVANVLSAQAIIDIPPPATFLSILPLSHTYEFTMGFLLPLANGCRVVYGDKAPTPAVIEAVCRHERPDAICAVPMVMDKIYKKRVLPAIAANFWLRHLVRRPWTRRLVMRRIGARLRHFFGNNLKVMAIGGAALNIETETFLRQAGFPYMAGYGMTETSPLLAAGRLADPTVTVGSVGKPVPGVEIRIDRPDPETGIGQIMARGANVMQGYYKNPGLTQETVAADGWLATGDLGLFDDRGNLHIKGRSKCVIVLSHGENIYPEAIEELLNACPEVVESLVRERNDRLEALVYLDYDLVDRAAGSREEQRRYIQQLLAEIKTTVNARLPLYAKIQSVVERTDPFIKTATHKIKRGLYQ